MSKTDTYITLLKMEFGLVQGQIDKYDRLSANIKTWAITLWTAVLGWSLHTGEKHTIFIGMFVVVVLWIFDAINKNFREDYKARRDEIATALHACLASPQTTKQTITPQMPTHQWSRVLQYVYAPHVALLYVALLVVSVLFL